MDELPFLQFLDDEADAGFLVAPGKRDFRPPGPARKWGRSYFFVCNLQAPEDFEESDQDRGGEVVGGLARGLGDCPAEVGGGELRRGQPGPFVSEEKPDPGLRRKGEHQGYRLVERQRGKILARLGCRGGEYIQVGRRRSQGAVKGGFLQDVLGEDGRPGAGSVYLAPADAA